PDGTASPAEETSLQAPTRSGRAGAVRRVSAEARHSSAKSGRTITRTRRFTATSPRPLCSCDVLSRTRPDPQRPRQAPELPLPVVERGARLVLAAVRADVPANDRARLRNVHAAIDVRGELHEQHHPVIGS